MGRQGEGAGPRSFPHPRRAAPGRTAVAIAPVHANAPTQDFVWRLVSARCRRTGQPAIAVDVLASTHAFRPPSQPSCPAQIREAVGRRDPGQRRCPPQSATSWPTRSGRCRGRLRSATGSREGSGRLTISEGGREGPGRRSCLAIREGRVGRPSSGQPAVCYNQGRVADQALGSGVACRNRRRHGRSG